MVMTCSAFQHDDASCLLAPAEAPGSRHPLACSSPREPEGLDPVDALSVLFGQPVPISPWRSSGGVRYIRRWRHGGTRGYLPPMRGHLITVTHVGSGMVIVTRAGKRVAGQLRRSAVSILPEGCHGYVDFTGERECSQVIVPSLLLRLCAQQMGIETIDAPIERVTIVDTTLFHLVDMLTSAEDQTPAGSLFREQCAMLICTHLLRRHFPQDRDEQAEAAQGLAAWQLRRLQEYMQEHLHAPLTLHDLAAQVTLSRHYVCTAFRHSTGFTPYEYLTTLRIRRAKELLVASRQSISDIAAAVGYGTASAFTASFRRATGTTPSRFRSQS